MCYVYTIGYEGLTTDSFVDTLSKNAIERVLDVREIPISRKPGFSKSKLMGILNSIGIDYIHMKELGSPKLIRDSLHETKDFDTFFYEYRHYIGTHFYLIQDTWELVTEKKTCLLCYEKKPSECHRSVIAEYLEATMPNVDGVINL